MWKIVEVIIWANIIVTACAAAIFLHGWFKSK